MRAFRLTMSAAFFVATTHAVPLLAQEQDCAALSAESGAQRQLAQQARQSAEIIRSAVYISHAIHNCIIDKTPDYTPTNLHSSIATTRNDPWFGTATPRGEMLNLHIRILDNAADFVAGNEFLDIFGLQQNPWAGLRNLEEELGNEMRAAEAQAQRFEETANTLAQRSIDCLVALAEAARADLDARSTGGAAQQDQGFTISDAPTAGTTQTAIPDAPPEGMTTLCRLTDGPRQGQTVNLSQEYGFPLYIPIGDICYDPKNDTSIGLAVEPPA